ncbi:MAG: CPCC family cysteine-rich protein [Alphaproteobacteria bacterium]
MTAGFACPCCGYLTRSRHEFGTFEICPVCMWEDDWIQSQTPHLEGGANTVSLNKAKMYFQKFGSSKEQFKSQCRAPYPDEKPDL